MGITKDTCHDGGPHAFSGPVEDAWVNDRTLVTTDACSKCGDARRCEKYVWNGEYEYDGGSGVCTHFWDVGEGRFDDADYVEECECVSCGRERTKRYEHAGTTIIDRHDTALN